MGLSGLLVSLMMDWPRGPSLIVTMVEVFSAPDIYIVVDSHGREADVASGRSQAGQKLFAGSARRLWEPDRPEALDRSPVGALDSQEPLGGVSGYQTRRLPQCATRYCTIPPFFPIAHPD